MSRNDKLALMLVIVPMYLGLLGCLGLFLGLLAFYDHWVWFGVLLGVEVYVAVAFVAQYRYGRQRRLAAASAEEWAACDLRP